MSFPNAKVVRHGGDPAEYHGSKIERGDPALVVSSSMLREFGACPARWRAGYVAPDSDAKDYGSLLDCLVLTPGDFAKRFRVKPATYTSEKGEVKPWNGNSNTCKAFLLDAETDGVSVVSQEELTEARAAGARLDADPVLKWFMDSSDKQVWLTGEWRDERTGLTIPIQALLDFAPREDSEFFEDIGDLKTTRCAHPAAWRKWSSQRGYHIQAALYIDMLNAATGQKRKGCRFVIQENFHPWQTAREKLSPQKLEFGRIIYKSLLARYCACLKTDKWPDYQEPDDKAEQGWSIDEADQWDEAQAMRASVAEPAAKDPGWAEGA